MGKYNCIKGKALQRMGKALLSFACVLALFSGCGKAGQAEAQGSDAAGAAQQDTAAEAAKDQPMIDSVKTGGFQENADLDADRATENGEKAEETEDKETGEGGFTEALPAQEENETDTDSLYGEVLDKYIQAVSEKWDMDKLSESGLSYLAGYAYGSFGDGSDPMESIGYYKEDVDGDGVEELFIGKNVNGEFRETIYQVYSIKNGKVTLVIDGGERDRYFLAKDGSFYNDGSSSAFNYVLLHYALKAEDKKLKLLDGVIYDEESGLSGKPYFKAGKGYEETGEMSGIGEDEFNAYFANAEKEYADIVYTPLATLDGGNKGRSGAENGDSGIGKTGNGGQEETKGGDEAGKQGYSNEELCKMALDYYEKKNNYRPGIAQVDSENGDLVTLHLFDDMGDHTATSAWYEIDRRTGRGQDTILGDEVDLVK
ncbi:MAG: hypothetical protein J6O55_03215 [Lachnospiraceae bacterium]|nr:hypothetical protein [Lachnospiraceae bacterium]